MNYHAILDIVQAHRLAMISVPVLLLAGWRFSCNEDLQPHRVPLAIALGMLGVIPLIWLISTRTNNRFAGAVLCVFLGFFTVRYLVRTIDRATNDFLGGLLYDVIFSEGAFAAIYRPRKKLPNLRLLQNWRANGFTRKAYRAARRSLINQQDAFPLWLFAAETSAIHLRKMARAVTIIRRLCISKQFTDDQKTFAINHLKGWAAAKGYDLNVLKLKSTYARSPKPTPLKDINRLRRRGCYQEARNQLLCLLRRDPENIAAAVLLVRVYAQDLHERHKAEQLINALEKKPFTSSGVVDFLRNSLDDWLSTPTTRITTSIPKCGPTSESSKTLLLRAIRTLIQPWSVSQARLEHSRKKARPAFVEKLSPEIAGLVTEGLLGTAVDTLELRIRQRPADFDLRLELAQVWILNCDYPGGAERIIAAIECDQRFTAAQKAAAKAQLVLWSKKYAEQNTLQLTCNAPVPNEVTAA